jgi:Ca2+/H+ antiporter
LKHYVGFRVVFRGLLVVRVSSWNVVVVVVVVVVVMVPVEFNTILQQSAFISGTWLLLGYAAFLMSLFTT